MRVYVIALLVFTAANSQAQSVQPTDTSTPTQSSTSVSESSGQSNNGEDAAVASWIGEVLGKSQSVARKIALLSSRPKKQGDLPEFLSVDTATFNALSFLEAVDIRNTSWDMKINRAKYAKRNMLEVVRELTGADFLIIANQNENWEILHFVGSKYEVIATGGKATSSKPEDIVSWFFSALKWDGIVLDSRGTSVLIATSASSLKNSKAQALTALKSDSSMSLANVKVSGSGLLSLTKAVGNYGVFEVVFFGQGISSLPIGTKVIIEKK